MIQRTIEEEEKREDLDGNDILEHGNRSEDLRQVEERIQNVKVENGGVSEEPEEEPEEKEEQP